MSDSEDLFDDSRDKDYVPRESEESSHSSDLAMIINKDDILGTKYKMKRNIKIVEEMEIQESQDSAGSHSSFSGSSTVPLSKILLELSEKKTCEEERIQDWINTQPQMTHVHSIHETIKPVATSTPKSKNQTKHQSSNTIEENKEESDEQNKEESDEENEEESDEENKEESDHTEQDNQSQPLRKKRKAEHKECIICGSMVINMSRHLKRVHAGMVIPVPVKSARGYIVKICPFPECCNIVERLRDHLIRYHKVANRSEELKDWLSKAEALTEQPDESSKKAKKEKKTNPNPLVVISSDEEPVNIIPIKQKFIEKPVPIVDSSSHTSAESSCKKALSPKRKLATPESRPSLGPGEDNSAVLEITIKTEPMSESEEEDIKTTMVHVIKPKVPAFMEDRRLKQFAGYLAGPSQNQNAKECSQHARQVHVIWTYLSKTMDVSVLTDGQQIEHWMASVMTQFQPGTVRSYLSSLRRFISFLILRFPETISIEEALRCKEHCSELSKGLRKKIRIRRTVVMTEEIETMIEPQDITIFLESDISTAAQNVLGITDTPFIQQEFYDARDFLLLRLLQTNAQRPMAVRSITRKTLKRALVAVQGATLMITDHKTAASGPVALGLNLILHRQLLNFITRCDLTPGLNLHLNHPIFVCWPIDGVTTPMSSSRVNQGIQRMWSAVSNKKLTSTRLRKATATNVRDSDPSMREKLASQMTHSPQTADLYYAVHNQRKEALGITQKIAQVMEPAPQTNTQLAITYANPQVQQQEQANPEEENPTANQQEMDNVLSSRIPSHGRRSFTETESGIINRLCHDLIRQQDTRVESVIGTLQATAEGQTLLLTLQDRFGPQYRKKIVDKIRAIVRTMAKKSINW